MLIRSRPPRPPPPARRQILPRRLSLGFADSVMIFQADGVDNIVIQHVSDDVIEASDSIQQALAEYWPDSVELNTLPTVGSYVAARYPDGSGFYRCLVLSIDGKQLRS